MNRKEREQLVVFKKLEAGEVYNGPQKLDS